MVIDDDDRDFPAQNWLFWFGLVFVGFIVVSPTGLIGVDERLIAPFR